MKPTNFHLTGSFVILNDIVSGIKTLVKSFCRSKSLYDFEDELIKCHLSRLMGERKLKIADVARDTGLHRNTITLLYDETASRVDLDAVDRLCEYFEVPVGDLLERQSSPPSTSTLKRVGDRDSRK